MSNTETMRPLHDRVLLKRKTAERTTPSGLVIPNDAQELSQRCEVLAVGPGHRLESGRVTPLDVQPGMTVLVAKFAGDIVKVGTEEHLIVREADILAIVNT